jgi:predicted alpha/beta superfamily hydrolase
MLRILIFFTLFITPLIQANEPIIAGYIDSHHSETLNQDRRFMVALPENYLDNTLTYPTLYVIDSDFQFQHVSAVVNNLTRMGKIPPTIVIGIANQGNADYVLQTTWSSQESSDYGGAEKFYQYISQELVPHISKRYRTNNNRVLSGYSLGGLFTTFAMVQKDSPFNAYFAMSPSYWFDEYSAEHSIANFFIENFKKQNKTPHPLFLSVANEQGMGVKKVYKSLDKLTLPNWQLTFKQYPQENHFSTALPALHDALGFLFKGFYEDAYELKAHKDVFDVLKTFKQKQTLYNGFRVEWLQAYKFSKYVFGSKQTDKIDEILVIINKDFPDSIINVTNYLAKGLNTTKQFGQALDILDRIQSLGKNTALWHHQRRFALAGLEQHEAATKAQTKAMSLAKEQGLPMWQIWEMK